MPGGVVRRWISFDRIVGRRSTTARPVAGERSIHRRLVLSRCLARYTKSFAYILPLVGLCGCSSPSWRLDRIIVEGVFTGDSCSYRYFGRGLSTRDTISVRGVTDVGFGEYPTGPWDFTDVSCQGLGIHLTRPRPSVILAGPYRLPAEKTGSGPVLDGGTLSGRAITAGSWPVMTGTFAVATCGEAVFDTLTSTRAVGRFRFVMQRRARGP